MIVHPLAFDRWATVEYLGDQQRRQYIADELRRLDRDGVPLLTVALAQTDDAVRHLAVTMLRDNADGEGKTIYDHGRQWMLALVEGEAPPDRDAQGRLLQPELRGKVLRTKVGNLGGNVPATADKHELSRWNAEARQSRERSRGDLYRYVDITRKPSPFNFDDAVKVLSAWGIGVSAKQYRRASTPDRAGVVEDAHGQCLWLVEEHAPAKATSVPTPRKVA